MINHESKLTAEERAEVEKVGDGIVAVFDAQDVPIEIALHALVSLLQHTCSILHINAFVAEGVEYAVTVTKQPEVNHESIH